MIRKQCLHDLEYTECRVIAELKVKLRKKWEFIQALSAEEVILVLMAVKENSRALFVFMDGSHRALSRSHVTG